MPNLEAFLGHPCDLYSYNLLSHFNFAFNFPDLPIAYLSTSYYKSFKPFNPFWSSCLFFFFLFHPPNPNLWSFAMAAVACFNPSSSHVSGHVSVIKRGEANRANKRARVKSVTWASRDQICQVGFLLLLFV